MPHSLASPRSSISTTSSVMNAAARMIQLMSRFAHISQFLCQLHWLKAHERIDCKLAEPSGSTIACMGLVQLNLLMNSVISRL